MQRADGAAGLRWSPSRPRLALGVVGGGVLAGLAFWAIAGVLNGDGRGGKRRNSAISRPFALVKFFTRHAILASSAYGMMIRLHLDPVGMLMGVTPVDGRGGDRSGRRGAANSYKFKFRSSRARTRVAELLIIRIG